MDLKNAEQIAALIDDLSLSVKKIIFANFPHLSAEEREEIDQEVKLKLLKMAAAGKKIDNFRSYVWRMVYTTALDAVGRRVNAMSLDDARESRRAALDSFVDEASPELLLERNEMMRLMEKTLADLPERRRTAVQLHFAGLDLKEIARWTGESENAARHLVYRGLEELKEKMAVRLNSMPLSRLVQSKKASDET